MSLVNSPTNLASTNGICACVCVCVPVFCIYSIVYQKRLLAQSLENRKNKHLSVYLMHAISQFIHWCRSRHIYTSMNMVISYFPTSNKQQWIIIENVEVGYAYQPLCKWQSNTMLHCSWLKWDVLWYAIHDKFIILQPCMEFHSEDIMELKCYETRTLVFPWNVYICIEGFLLILVLYLRNPLNFVKLLQKRP